MKNLISGVHISKNQESLNIFVRKANTELYEIIMMDVSDNTKKDLLREKMLEYEQDIRMKVVNASIAVNYKALNNFADMNNIPALRVNIFGVEYRSPSHAAWVRDEPIDFVLKQLRSTGSRFYVYLKNDDTEVPETKETDEIEFYKQEVQKITEKYRKSREELKQYKREIFLYKTHAPDVDIKEIMEKKNRNKVKKKVVPYIHRKRLHTWKGVEILIDGETHSDIYSVKETSVNVRLKILDPENKDYTLKDPELYKVYLQRQKEYMEEYAE